MTKLIYIGNDGDNKDLHFKGLSIYQDGLTINKVYEGNTFSEIDLDFYYIDKNDDGVGHYYHRFLFRDLEEIRNEKIDIVIN